MTTTTLSSERLGYETYPIPRTRRDVMAMDEAPLRRARDDNTAPRGSNGTGAADQLMQFLISVLTPEELAKAKNIAQGNGSNGDPDNDDDGHPREEQEIEQDQLAQDSRSRIHAALDRVRNLGGAVLDPPIAQVASARLRAFGIDRIRVI